MQAVDPQVVVQFGLIAVVARALQVLDLSDRSRCLSLATWYGTHRARFLEYWAGMSGSLALCVRCLSFRL